MGEFWCNLFGKRSCTLLLCLFLFGCNGKEDDDSSADDDSISDDDADDDDDDDSQDPLDEDGDGWTEIEGDCDDTNPNVYPGADDPPCDGIDHDCDGALGATLNEVLHATIQDAIDAALSGETVSICTGTHSEKFSITEQTDLHLTSESNDSQSTVLDGGGRGPILRVGSTVDNVRIDNLTFKSGFAISESGGEQDGGAINSDATRLVVEDCQFNDNWAERKGGAIYHSGNSADLVGSSFDDNAAGDSGGAIVLDHEEGTYVLRDSSLSSNNASYCGGAAFYTGSLSLDNVIFNQNEALFYGGGVAWESNDDSALALVDTVLENNSSNCGGGIALVGASDTQLSLLVNGSSFLNNHAFYLGGALYWEGSGEAGMTTTFVLEDSAFTGNSSESAGGAVAVDGPSVASSTMQRVSFTSNSASAGGGAVFLEPDIAVELLVQECEFSQNSVNTFGGAIHVGGASENETTPYTIYAVNSVFNDNFGDGGAAIRCASGPTDVERYLYLSGGSVTQNEQGGVLLDTGCMLESYIVNWGTGSVDNQPFDIDTGTETYDSFGSAETFFCEGGGICL